MTTTQTAEIMQRSPKSLHQLTRKRTQGHLDCHRIVNAATPGPAADLLQQGPQPRVAGKIGIGFEGQSRMPLGQDSGRGFWFEAFFRRAEEVDRAR